MKYLTLYAVFCILFYFATFTFSKIREELHPGAPDWTLFQRSLLSVIWPFSVSFSVVVTILLLTGILDAKKLEKETYDD